MAEPVNCPSCGVKVRAGRARCPKCRAELPAHPPAPVRPVSEATRRAAALAVVVLLAGVTAAVFWPREAPDLRAVPAPAAAVPAPSPPAPAAPAAPARPASADPPFLTAGGAGKLDYERGDYEGALGAFEQAIKRNPDDAESHSNLGQVLVRMGRVEEAIPHFERAVALIPDRWAYHFNLARAAGESGDWDRAVSEYRVAQRLFPDDYVTEYNLARALHKAGDEAAAVEGYLRAIALDPQDPTFRLSLGISYEALGRRPEAVAAYEDYLRLAPEAADADKVNARIALLTSSPGPGGAAPGQPASGRRP